jgi:hypothetical protein
MNYDAAAFFTDAAHSVASVRTEAYVRCIGTAVAGSALQAFAGNTLFPGQRIKGETRWNSTGNLTHVRERVR